MAHRAPIANQSSRLEAAFGIAGLDDLVDLAQPDSSFALIYEVGMALRYGIVGGGFISAFQVKSLRQVRGVEVAGLVSRRPPESLAAYVREQRPRRRQDLRQHQRRWPRTST